MSTPSPTVRETTYLCIPLYLSASAPAYCGQAAASDQPRTVPGGSASRDLGWPHGRTGRAVAAEGVPARSARDVPEPRLVRSVPRAGHAHVPGLATGTGAGAGRIPATPSAQPAT